MKPVIAIVGPTAVGKTSFSILLAKQLNGEIISCDSMQLYKQLDIGTAKVTKSEMEGIKHHFIDSLDVSDEFSVSVFQKQVRSKIEELLERDIQPILVGGSGLFVQAVLYDYQFPGDKRSVEHEQSVEHRSTEELYQEIIQKNPLLANHLDLGNRRRILRAYFTSEVEVEEVLNQGKTLYYPSTIIIGLTLPRELLYERINQRVDMMVENGVLNEALMLYEKYPTTQASKAIGYKEFFPYFRKECDLEQAISEVKMASRRYAKRQMTWFKNKMDVYWIDISVSTKEEMLDFAQKLVEKKR